MQLRVSDNNRQAWASWFTGLDYQRASELFPAERAILRQLEGELAGKRILDIGVGTGRTTPALRALASGYVGVDYSAEMVRRARQRFPGVDFRQVDARDLSAFDTGSFDCVWFSFNGIDCVSHEDRLVVLGEIRRVLARTGSYCFSTHNRDWLSLRQAAGAIQPVSWTAHPVKMSYRLMRHLRATRNLRRLGGSCVQAEEYAIVNDAAHDFSLLLYYISLPAQVRQLQQAGFNAIVAIAGNGEALPLDQPYVADSSIHFIARA